MECLSVNMLRIGNIHNHVLGGYKGLCALSVKRITARWITCRYISTEKEEISSEEANPCGIDKLKGMDPRTGEQRIGRNFNYKMELGGLAERLGHSTEDLPSLQTALVHRSALHMGEDGSSQTGHLHNGRLAVLGKSVLVHYLQEYLYYTYPNMEGNALWDIGNQICHPTMICNIADYLGISELILTRKTIADTGHRGIKYKAFTAVLGAVYNDKGPLAARKIVGEFIIPVLKTADLRELIKLQHPSFVLRAILKEKGKSPPKIRLLSETGRLSHFPSFVVGVYSQEQLLGEGSGTSLKRAEKEAMSIAVRNHFMKELKNISLPSNNDKKIPSFEEK